MGLNEEEPRLEGIRALAEKVLPGTNHAGQANIRAQVDSSQQEWHSLLAAIQYVYCLCLCLLYHYVYSYY